jgi:hypothetical protein
VVTKLAAVAPFCAWATALSAPGPLEEALAVARATIPPVTVSAAVASTVPVCEPLATAVASAVAAPGDKV